MEEQIRETTWNLCKEYDAKRHSTDKVRLKAFVSTQLEKQFGIETENEYRQEWQDEVNLFCTKYGYS